MASSDEPATPVESATYIAVLGPVGISAGTRFVAPSAPILRALLAALTLAPEYELSSSALYAAVWGDRPVSRNTLPVTIHRLRAWLADHATQVGLDRTALGYRLVCPGAGSDLVRFRKLVDSARDASGEERVRALNEALALWRGRALQDVLGSLGAERLDRERRSAVALLDEALLADEQADRAVAVLSPDGCSTRWTSRCTPP